MRSLPRSLGAVARILLFSVLCAPAVRAQSVGERLVILKIDFGRQLYWIENANGSIVKIHGHPQAAILRQTSDVFLPKATVARLVVTRANPLVYRYASEAKALTDTNDFTAASSFASALAAVIKLLGAPPIAPAGAPAGGVVPAAMRTAGDVVVDQVLRQNGLQDVASLDVLLAKLDEAMTILRAKDEQISPLFIRAKIEQTDVRRIVCGAAAECTWDLLPVAETIVNGFAKLDRIHEALAFNPESRDHPVTTGLSQVLQHRDLALKGLKAAQDFAAAVAKIDQDLTLPNDAAYLLSKNRPIDVTRTELTVSGDPKTDSATTFTLTFRPDSPVTYGFGGDYVYAFVRGSTFSAKKKGDDLVIAETPLPDYVGSKIGAVMSITPTRWINTPFTPFAEVGVNVKGIDKIGESAGFLAGIGFSPYGVFNLGGGVLLQQVPLLDGQQVGDVVASADAIKTTFRFKRGWYLHLGVVKKLGS